MDVRLSHEQELVRATAADIGAQHAITGVRDLPLAPGSTGRAWQTLAEAGLLGLGNSLAPGDGSALAAMLVVEQLAATSCPAPFVGQGVLAPALVAAAGAAEHVAALTEGTSRYCVLLAGDLTAIAAPDEPSVAFDAGDATHGLTVDGDGVVRLHALPADACEQALDLTRRILTDLPVSVGERIGGEVADESTRDRLAALALAAVASDVLGLMQGALGMSVDYAKDRRQFGRPIGANQALAHVLADAAVLVEASRSCVWHAGWALDAADSSLVLAAARQAKAFCAAAGREVLEAAVQTHGGIAITWEHPLHLLQRRVLFDVQLFGRPQLLHAQIAKHRQLTDPRSTPPSSSVPSSDGVSFADSTEETSFRARLREWLTFNTPQGPLPRDGDERMAVLHGWHRRLASGGWTGVAFAREYGGQGLSLLYEAIVNDELAAAAAPPGPAINHITNAIRLFGTEEQKRAQLPGMLACTTRWCQGFSEPGAGSDLASLTTHASLLTGDDGRAYYRVNGQKLWTSEAVWADWCLLLLRTEVPAETPRPHQSLSMLMVPMTTPGVDCRPVRTSYGSSEFAEVFFTDAHVPAANLLGQPGQGWQIAMALLGFERGPADMGWTARLQRLLADGETQLRNGELSATDVQRSQLANAWVELEALRLQVLRSTSRRPDGSAPGPEGSLDKLLMTRVEQLLNHVLLDLNASAGVLDEQLLFSHYVWSRAQAIFGGSQQIQRDLVAQRVLGLPRPH